MQARLAESVLFRVRSTAFHAVPLSAKAGGGPPSAAASALEKALRRPSPSRASVVARLLCRQIDTAPRNLLDLRGEGFDHHRTLVTPCKASAMALSR